MKMPEENQINEVKSLIKNCICELIINDSEIFDEAENIAANLSDPDKEFDRKLHEITINHRLAFYIRHYLK